MKISSSILAMVLIVVMFGCSKKNTGNDPAIIKPKVNMAKNNAWCKISRYYKNDTNDLDIIHFTWLGDTCTSRCRNVLGFPDQYTHIVYNKFGKQIKDLGTSDYAVYTDCENYCKIVKEIYAGTYYSYVWNGNNCNQFDDLYGTPRLRYKLTYNDYGKLLTKFDVLGNQTETYEYIDCTNWCKISKYSLKNGQDVTKSVTYNWNGNTCTKVDDFTGNTISVMKYNDYGMEIQRGLNTMYYSEYSSCSE